MTPEQTRIQADLRGILSGDVYCDPLITRLYASDASIYELQPLGVVRPRSTDDVVKLVGYAAEHHLSLFPRGGGSGLAGQALGAGLVLDFSRYMRRAFAPSRDRVRVQCGIVQADLNRALLAQGLIFGPDPATRSVSSIGSMLSIDAAGSHFPAYGSAGDRVESMQVVLGSGEVVELSRHRWALDNPPANRLEELVSRTGLLLQQHAGLILRPPWGEVARGCGYRIEKALDGDVVDLARLMCGSEGTLGIITEATLRLDPLPVVRGVMLLFFERLDGAAKAAIDIARDEIAACDLMDRRLIEIVRDADSGYASLLPKGAEAMLLVEVQGDEPVGVRQRLNQLVQRLQRRGRALISFRITTDNQERDWLWRLARRVIPRLYRLKGTTRALPFVEDIAIPPKRLPEFLVEVQNILKSFRVTATVFAHAAHGHLDLRPFLDLSNPADNERMQRLAESIYGKVLDYGGCISGEHALGLSRAGFAAQQLGPRLELFRQLRSIFDPNGLMNPGKFLSDTPQQVVDNLRSVPTFIALPIGNGEANWMEGADAGSELIAADSSTTPRLFPTPADAAYLPNTDSQVGEAGAARAELPANGNASLDSRTDDSDRGPRRSVELPLLLDWSGSQSLAQTARSCNGCGRCRTSAQAERMCPMFRIHKGEEATPRAKANLMRGFLTGHLDPATLDSDALKGIADLCFNCHQCRTECPAAVDIPKLVVEMKAQHVASHGLSLSDRFLNRLDWLASLGSRLPKISNWALDNPRLRWLLEKFTGIAQGRKLPKVSRRSFIHWAIRRKIHKPSRGGGRKVLFFVDQYVNWHNPVLGRALVEVLEHQKVEVYCPPNQTPSYMAMIAAGDVQRARRLIKPNIQLLADAVRQGYQIVATEPSAALCLKHEYRQLIDNEDTRLIAENTFESCSYLWQMHLSNELELDFRPLNMSLLYHEPCHARVLDPRQPALNLLRLIPGMQVEDANAGCSGMAGTYGLKQKNYRNSLRIGWGLISSVKETSAQLGITECTACKLQMEQATTKPAVHPVAILAFAYGTMPQLAGWFSARHEGLVVT
jgi:FAD/FMN-containing dehydrogenase/Fe-S oxidoreductase